MKLYHEFEEALYEVAGNAKEEKGFAERFSKMIKNYMNGMKDLPNLENVIIETISSGEKDEN